MLLVMQREYFVKYQGLAHAHNRWITESTMLLEAPKLLAKFKSEPKVHLPFHILWTTNGSLFCYSALPLESSMKIISSLVAELSG